jgi:hypothetical protein
MNLTARKLLTLRRMTQMTQALRPGAGRPAACWRVTN